MTAELTPQPEKKLSAVEALKDRSNFLRGNIKEEEAQPTTHFNKDNNVLLKSHGTYEQDDRDTRQKLLAEKKEPAYSMMVRVKIPGGRVTPEQYAVYDDLAAKCEYGNMRITTRQGIQFHGVLKKNLKSVIAEINAALATTLGACGDNVRNVLYCPAPFTDRNKHDIFKYVKAVSDQFLHRSGAYQEIWLNGQKIDHLPPVLGEEPIYGKTYLPRKFKIAFAFPDDNCTDIYSNDMGIVPEIQNGELKGFNLVIGGGFGTTHGVATTYPRLASPVCFCKPEELLETTKAVVIVQRDFGNRADRKRARLKYLVDEKGVDWFRSEMEKVVGKKIEPAHPIHWKTIENHLGWFEEGNGKWSLGLYIENGRVKDEGNYRLKSGLRAVVDKYKCMVFLTCQQDIILSGFSERQKKELEDMLVSYGIPLPNTLSAIRKDAMACPALPTCGLAISESERFMPSVISEIEKKADALGLQGKRIMIRMTGCPNGCARPYNAEIALVGRTVGTYNIYVGGNLTGTRLNKVLYEKIPGSEVAARLEPALALYKKEARPNEDFGDFCHRVGVEKLRIPS